MAPSHLGEAPHKNPPGVGEKDTSAEGLSVGRSRWGKESSLWGSLGVGGSVGDLDAQKLIEGSRSRGSGTLQGIQVKGFGAQREGLGAGEVRLTWVGVQVVGTQWVSGEGVWGAHRGATDAG